MADKLEQGAYTTINQCLKLQANERLVIITDEDTLDVGNALYEEAKKVADNVLFLKIEDYTQRPATEIPQEMLNKLSEFKPTVSIYAAQGRQGELPVFRMPLVNILTEEYPCRHAHMISITKKLMEIGMNVDYEVVYRVTHNVLNIVKNATKIHVTDPHGTEITYELDPQNIKWIPDDGSIRQDEWTNLPGGEVFTAIKNCNGVIYGWMLGDYLSEKYGELKEPMKITIENSFITSIEGPEPMRTDFETYVNEHENGKRCGELGIGTLIGVNGFVGNLLQDEKYPGIHMAFGSPYPEKTGADWECPSHIDVIAKDTTINVHTNDEMKTIMTDGRYIEEILNS